MLLIDCLICNRVKWRTCQLFIVLVVACGQLWLNFKYIHCCCHLAYLELPLNWIHFLKDNIYWTEFQLNDIIHVCQCHRFHRLAQNVKATKCIGLSTMYYAYTTDHTRKPVYCIKWKWWSDFSFDLDPFKSIKNSAPCQGPAACQTLAAWERCTHRQSKIETTSVRNYANFRVWQKKQKLKIGEWKRIRLLSYSTESYWLMAPKKKM